MTRRVTLCFQNLVEEYMVPVHALALIKGIAPVLTAGSDPIVFSVDDEEEAEVIRVVVKWLLRETIGDLVEDRRQFCAAVRFADKWDVPALLKDLDLWYCSTMVTLEKMFYVCETEMTIGLNCKKCGEEHLLMTTYEPSYMFINEQKHERHNNLDFIKNECWVRCTQPPEIIPRMEGLFGVVAAMRQRLGHINTDLLTPGNIVAYSDDGVEAFDMLEDYFHAARVGMPKMLAALLPYVAYVVQKDKCVTRAFFRRLRNISAVIACDWATSVFEDHERNCLCGRY